MELRKIPGFIWMPVRTKPRQEKKLAEYSKANNIPCYLPLIRKLKRYDRRTVESFIPMFSGYVFCSLNEEAYQKLVRSNAIVYRITLDEDQEDELLSELKDIQALERLSHEKEIVVKPELVTGSKVLITSGPMKGSSGYVEQRRSKTIISVNIEFLQQSVSVVLDAGDLELDED